MTDNVAGGAPGNWNHTVLLVEQHQSKSYTCRLQSYIGTTLNLKVPYRNPIYTCICIHTNLTELKCLKRGHGLHGLWLVVEDPLVCGIPTRRAPQHPAGVHSGLALPILGQKGLQGRYQVGYQVGSGLVLRHVGLDVGLSLR